MIPHLLWEQWQAVGSAFSLAWCHPAQPVPSLPCALLVIRELGITALQACTAPGTAQPHVCSAGREEESPSHREMEELETNGNDTAWA